MTRSVASTLDFVSGYLASTVLVKLSTMPGYRCFIRCIEVTASTRPRMTSARAPSVMSPCQSSNTKSSGPKYVNVTIDLNHQIHSVHVLG